ncbi:MAG: hypothetical protein ACOCZB_01630 [Spirochaetota bacterium]
MKRRPKTIGVAVLVLVLLAIAGLLIAHLPAALRTRITSFSNDGRIAEAIRIQARLVRVFPRDKETYWSLNTTTETLLHSTPVVVIGSAGHAVAHSGETAVAGSEDLVAELIDQIDAVVKRDPPEVWATRFLERKARLLETIGRTSDAIAIMRHVADRRREGAADCETLRADLWLLDRIGEAGERLERARRLVDCYVPERGHEPGLSAYSESELHVAYGDAAAAAQAWIEAEEAYERAADAAGRAFDRAWEEEYAEMDPDVAPKLEEEPHYVAAQLGLRLARFAQREDAAQHAARVYGSILPAEPEFEDSAVWLQPITADRDPMLVGVRTMYTNGSMSTEGYRARVQADGSFAFDLLPPGSYRFHLTTSVDRLVGFGRPEVPDVLRLEGGETREIVVRFAPRVALHATSPGQDSQQTFPIRVGVRWDPVPDAAYYDVWMHVGDGGTQVLERTEERSYETTYDRLDLWVSSGPSTDPDGLKPASILGRGVPGTVIAPVVQARNADGRLLTDSDGYVLSNTVYPYWIVPDDFGVRYGPLADPARKTAEREYAEAAAMWNELVRPVDSSDSEPSNGESALTGPENQIKIHLALARLHANVSDPSVRNAALAEQHYEEVLRIANEFGIRLPSTIASESEMMWGVRQP